MKNQFCKIFVVDDEQFLLRKCDHPLQAGLVDMDQAMSILTLDAVHQLPDGRVESMRLALHCFGPEQMDRFFDAFNEGDVSECLDLLVAMYTGMLTPNETRDRIQAMSLKLVARIKSVHGDVLAPRHFDLGSGCVSDLEMPDPNLSCSGGSQAPAGFQV